MGCGKFLKIRQKLPHLIFVFSTPIFLSACLVEPGSESGLEFEEINENNGGGVGVKPKTLCGEGRAVVAIDSSGQVVCDAPQIEGLAAVENPSGQLSCTADELASVENIVTAKGTLPLVSCKEKIPPTTDDATLGESPLEEFGCPFGTALMGVNDKGKGICRTLVPARLDRLTAVSQNGECLFGMALGTLDFGDFNLNVCVVDKRAPRETLTANVIAKTSLQRIQRCASGLVVVGFDEAHGIICGPGPNLLREVPRRYWTIEFDGSIDKPVCLKGFSPERLRPRTLTGNSVKIWTCVKDA